MKFDKCKAFLVAILIFLVASMHVSHARSSSSYPPEQLRGRFLKGNATENIQPLEKLRNSTMDVICSKPEYSAITATQSMVSAIKLMTDATDGKQLCTPMENAECIVTKSSRIRRQMNELKTKILSVHDVCKELTTVSEIFEKNGFTATSLQVFQIEKYSGLLIAIEIELRTSIKNRSTNSYKQCETLPSRRVYELFSDRNLHVYTEILRHTVGEVNGPAFISRLNTLLLNMFQMSNLCNESYFLGLNNPVYTCNARIDIDGLQNNVKKILVNGNKKGLADVKKIEKSSKNEYEQEDSE